MPPTVYRVALIALMQALKAVIVSERPEAEKRWDYRNLYEALRHFAAVLPPQELEEVHSHLIVMLNGLPHPPDPTAWPALCEMCQDMLATLGKR